MPLLHGTILQQLTKNGQFKPGPNVVQAGDQSLLSLVVLSLSSSSALSLVS